MTFKEFFENWDTVGSGATVQDEEFAQEKLREALRKLVKDPYANYKKNRIYLGDVREFFPKSSGRMAHVPVYWNPNIVDCAARVSHDGYYATMDVGKFGYKHQGTSRSLGATFIHEIEHLHDLMIAQNYEVKDDKVQLSEFTPRLRQAIRQLKDEPNFRIWNYLNPKNGRDFAANYVDRFLDNATDYKPTPQEKEFAIDAVIKRAKEIFDQTGFANQK